MNDLVQSCMSHLRKVLGVSVVPERWHGTEHLPFFLSHEYSFYCFTLLDTPCLLAHACNERETTPLTISKHIALIRQHWNGEVIYLCEAISPYARKRLIEQKILFVVPGSQLFLPTLGIDLREHYRSIRPDVVSVSPSAQAVIIYALVHGREQPFTPSVLAKRMGYTRMTMTRAFDELQAAEIGETVFRGKERLLHMPDGTAALWQRASGLMCSPVKKRLWIRRLVIEQMGVPAGLTALAASTLLAAPDCPVFAIGPAEWKTLRQKLHDQAETSIAQQDEQCCELELWSYSPHIFAGGDHVDPFSLYLSLRAYSDERVQFALTRMMEQVLW